MPLHIPRCPSCGHDAPPSLLFWSLYKPFECEGCGKTLIVPKTRVAFMGVAGYLAYWRFKDGMTGMQEFGLILLIATVLLILSWMAMHPKLANPEPRH